MTTNVYEIHSKMAYRLVTLSLLPPALNACYAGYLKIINLGLSLSGQTISGFMHPSDPTGTEIPSFESAYEIILTDAKFITKQQYSSDLWPLKVKRNCIVDKSLKIII